MVLLIGKVATHSEKKLPNSLISTGYPIPPISVSVSNVADTFATVSWIVPNSPGFVDSFTIEYNGQTVVNIQNGTRSSVLTGLAPNAIYTVGVATKNILQTSSFTNSTFTTASERSHCT